MKNEAMTDCASNGLKGGFGTFNFFVLLTSLVDTNGLDGFTSDNSVVSGKLSEKFSNLFYFHVHYIFYLLGLGS